MWIVNSFSTMPPGSPIRCRVCRRATCTPWTTSRDSAGTTRNTSPCLPLSRPVMTTTLSPFLTLSFAISEHFRGERGDFQEFAGPKLSGNRAEDARPDRLVLAVDQHSGIAVKTYRTAVDAAN